MSYSDYDIVSSTKLTKNKTLIKTLIGTNNFDLHVTIPSTEQITKHFRTLTTATYLRFFYLRLVIHDAFIAL